MHRRISFVFITIVSLLTSGFVYADSWHPSDETIISFSPMFTYSKSDTNTTWLVNAHLKTWSMSDSGFTTFRLGGMYRNSSSVVNTTSMDEFGSTTSEKRELNSSAWSGDATILHILDPCVFHGSTAESSGPAFFARASYEANESSGAYVNDTYVISFGYGFASNEAKRKKGSWLNNYLNKNQYFFIGLALIGAGIHPQGQTSGPNESILTWGPKIQWSISDMDSHLGLFLSIVGSPFPRQQHDTFMTSEFAEFILSPQLVFPYVSFAPTLKYTTSSHLHPHTPSKFQINVSVLLNFGG